MINKSASNKTIRCAIYTRKSTNEGLEQAFNSLDAQREAAEAYIESQKHEGWLNLPERYDDGGFSGGNLERPALIRLLEDIEAKKIDCIVVYKVDRLSRSLLDFARIMESFDKNGVSFVSVTQQFNTTQSMGRLTLNILLSFAQFEREIIAERTRDKMSAARRKGKWTGGMPVLGYDIDSKGKGLVINKEEAGQVRSIFELYLENRSLITTANELNQRGWVNKQWITKKGMERGGNSFNKGNLFRLLTNIVYLGKVNFKGEIYKGEHPAIINPETWEKVQRLCRRNGKNGGKDVRNKYGALLKGLLYCIPCSSMMTHSYTVRKQGKRYRYYVCSHAQKNGWDSCPTKSLPAAEIENFVIDRIRCIGKDPQLLSEALEQARLQLRKTIEELKGEGRELNRRLDHYRDQVQKLAERLLSNNDISLAAELSDLENRIRISEKRAFQIREELSALGRGAFDEEEFSSVLSQFAPVWETLSSREQARVIYLLVDKIGYDGANGSLTINFRSTGIKALTKEIDLKGEETKK